MSTATATATRPSVMRPTAADEIRRWLETFAACVRDVDYDRARDMFDPGVVGFGTFASMLVGREELIDGQWRNIWGCTRGFRFVLEQAHVEVSGAGEMAFVATPWHSQGRDAAGNWFDRLGRCTLVLRRHGGAGADGAGAWRCVHSHYSRQPEPKITAGGATPA